MNNVFTAKLLNNLRNKKAEKGFTLIELLVVVIIVGILSAVALPQFLNQASRARQVEAETTLGAINRAQQTHRLQNTTFGTLDQLVTSGTISMNVTGTGTGNTGAVANQDYFQFYVVAADATDATTDAAPQSGFANDLRQYQGAVYQDPTGGAFNSVLCRSTVPPNGTGFTAPVGDADPAATTVCANGAVVN